MSTIEQAKATMAELYVTRRKRISNIMRAYEVELGHTERLVGHREFSDAPMRYVVVSESSKDFGYFLEGARDLRDVAEVAADEVVDPRIDLRPVCYYDLDELAGEVPLPQVVKYEDEEWMVHGFEYELGETTGRWTLKKQPSDRRRATYDWVTVDPSDVDVLGWEDERMPVRYSVAKIQTVVAFNTIPERP